jgi:hypothetical protein
MMTNDDAKYREWWEKLKRELKLFHDVGDVVEGDGYYAAAYIRMLQIENEDPK